MPKRLPIGISDFQYLIDGDYAYVDKTLLIEEFLDQGTLVALIPRLRRFGKTLNLSMLRYFFEKGKEDTSYLFKGLKIWKNKKLRKLQGQFPVIFISFKDVKYTTWEETFDKLRLLIAAEFERHSYLLDGEILSPGEKEDYHKIVHREHEKQLFEDSLLLLSKWLHRFHNKKVFLLIDEYDTPVHAAYLGKCYDIFIGFLRNFLSASLKDNVHLERGLLTGILRIAKESIFSGLNNISTFTILHDTFSDKFGLLESEVEALLEDYGLSDKLSNIRTWYNGYRIGSSTNIYNPWSVLSCIANKGALAPYWVNTSENSLMKQLITQGTEDFKANIEQLVRGEVVEEEIEEGIIFPELHQNPTAIWSLLLFTGYLTLDRESSYGIPCRLRIPNVEVGELYRSMILDWFKQTIHKQKYEMLLKSLTTGDIETFSRIFQDFMTSSVSVFDVSAEEPEKIYHAFVLGLLVGLKDTYEVKSNRESGYGRYDVMLIPKNSHDLGLVLEFKKVDASDDLEASAESALQQVEERHYAQELVDRGVQQILYLGLAFKGKKTCIAHRYHKSSLLLKRIQREAQNSVLERD